jgi:hypothetical protein
MLQPKHASQFVLAVAALSVGAAALAATEPAAPDERLARIINELVARNQQRIEELSRYTSKRRYFVENKRFGQDAAVEVLEHYEPPGRKQFDILNEEGSSFVQNIVHKMIAAELESSEDEHRARTQITPEHYTFEWVEETKVDGRPAYVIQVEPRKKKSFLIRGRIWIDAEEMAIVRMEGSPAKKPSFWVVGRAQFVRTYSKHGRFWLPSTMETTSSVLLAGKSFLRIEYSDYQFDALLKPGGSTSGVTLGTKLDVKQNAQVNLVDHVIGPR